MKDKIDPDRFVTVAFAIYLTSMFLLLVVLAIIGAVYG